MLESDIIPFVKMGVALFVLVNPLERDPHLHGGCTPADYLILSSIVALVGVATWLALRAADPLRRALGDTGIDVSTRVSGLIVTAIAVEMAYNGLLSLFPQLAVPPQPRAETGAASSRRAVAFRIVRHYGCGAWRD